MNASFMPRSCKGHGYDSYNVDRQLVVERVPPHPRVVSSCNAAYAVYKNG